MDPLQLKQIADWCEGRLLQGDPQAQVLRVCTDSRMVSKGDCFVALKGERFDGHAFVDAAAKAGALAAIVSEIPAGHMRSDMALIKVADTLQALQKVAGNYRNSKPLKVIAITGSNGKTTTKEMTASVLSRRFTVVKSDGNFNNHIGVPLSLLNISDHHQFGIFELGTNHPGEIASLASLARPDVAIVTNIAPAHLEYFGSVAAIAKEKGTLVQSLTGSGIAILNADDKWTPMLKALCRGQVLTIGIKCKADLRARALSNGDTTQFSLHVTQTRQETAVTLPVRGQHLIYSALFAAAAGLIFSMALDDIAEGLKLAKLPQMRMQEENVGGVRIINDAYNANPASMQAALETFGQMRADGRKIVVLGDMLELGDQAAAAHEKIGKFVVKTVRPQMLVTVGPLARAIGESAKRYGQEPATVAGFATAGEAAAFLKKTLRSGDLLLLKGSRRVGLEQILESLQSNVRERSSG